MNEASEAVDLHERKASDLAKQGQHAAALKQHPDKGGTHEAFLEVQRAYEALKEHARAD